MSNLRYQLRKLLDILKWIKSMLRLPVRLFAWILLFIFGKDNRPPNLPRDDYDEGGLLELQRPERKAQRVVEAWIMVDEETKWIWRARHFRRRTGGTTQTIAHFP